MKLHGLAQSCASRRLMIGAILVVLAASPRFAAAEGALAVGLPDDVARDGVAIGMSYNYRDRAGAEERALKECRSFVDAPESTRTLCKIIETFSSQCLAVSLDPKAGTPGVGWAIAPSKEEAE